MKKEVVYTNIELDEGFSLSSAISSLFRGAKSKGAAPASTGNAAATSGSDAQAQTDKTNNTQSVQLSTQEQQVINSTSDITLPQAIVIKSLLTKQIGPSLAKVLGGFSQEDRKAIMTPIMQYLNTLPKMASQVIAEEVKKTPSVVNPQQQASLKAQLAAKHSTNSKIINKNLQAVQNQIFNQIKFSLDANNAANLLFNAIDKQHGNTKQGLQYMKSLQNKSEPHLEVLLANIQLVLDNVMLLLQKHMPQKQETQKPNLPESRNNKNNLISESQINRWKVLAEVKW